MNTDNTDQAQRNEPNFSVLSDPCLPCLSVATLLLSLLANYCQSLFPTFDSSHFFRCGIWSASFGNFLTMSFTATSSPANRPTISRAQASAFEESSIFE